jgi:hypothetical protein
MKLDENGVFRGRIMRNVHLTASRGVALLSAVVFAILAGSALADEIKTRTWTGNGADNLWTNPDNWEPSEVSGSSYNNVFPAGRDWEVVIETDPRYYSLQLPEGSGTVTFKGAGQLKDDNNAYIQVGAGREINVDGVVFRLCKNSCSENAFINGTLRLTSRSITTYGSYDSYHVIGGDAKVIVEGGEFGSSNSYLCLSNNATLTVRGGLGVAQDTHSAVRMHRVNRLRALSCLAAPYGTTPITPIRCMFGMARIWSSLEADCNGEEPTRFNTIASLRRLANIRLAVILPIACRNSAANS